VVAATASTAERYEKKSVLNSKFIQQALGVLSLASDMRPGRTLTGITRNPSDSWG
jgi:hypothetical protein